MTIMMTREQHKVLGRQLKEALPHNMIVGAFSAELIGESYPLTKSLWDIIFESYTDEELGIRFVKYTQEEKS